MISYRDTFVDCPQRILAIGSRRGINAMLNDTIAACNHYPVNNCGLATGMFR